MEERSVRIFTGEDSGWQWTFDPHAVAEQMKKVAEAEDSVLRAKQDEQDQEIISKQQAYIDDLKLRNDTASIEFEALQKRWDEQLELIKAMYIPTETMGEILEELASVQTPQLKTILENVSAGFTDLFSMLTSFGFGFDALAGFSATGNVSGTAATFTPTGKTSGALGDWMGTNPSGSEYMSYKDYLENKVEWSTATPERQAELHTRNDLFRGAIGAFGVDTVPVELAKEMLKDGHYTESKVKIYDRGGILKGLGGIKATNKEEVILGPDITAKALDPQKSKEFTALTENLKFVTDSPELSKFNKIAEKFKNFVGDDVLRLNALKDNLYKSGQIPAKGKAEDSERTVQNYYQLYAQGVVKEINPYENVAEMFARLVPNHT